MATLTPIQRVNHVGASIEASGVSAAVGGDAFPNDGDVLIYLRNASGSSITVTAVTQIAPTGLAVNDTTITVPSLGVVVAGPFPPEIYNDASGLVQLTYSSVTSFSLAAIQLPNN